MTAGHLAISSIAGGERLQTLPILDGVNAELTLQSRFGLVAEESNTQSAAGVAGFFFASQCSTYDLLTEAEYREFGVPYDLDVISSYQEDTYFNVHLDKIKIILSGDSDCLLRKLDRVLIHVWDVVPDTQRNLVHFFFSQCGLNSLFFRLFAIQNSINDVYIMLLFGIIGYFMLKFGFSTAALVLGMVLSNTLEANYRRAVILAKGDMVGYFFSRPIAVIFAILLIIVLVAPPIVTKLIGDLADLGKLPQGEESNHAHKDVGEHETQEDRISSVCIGGKQGVSRHQTVDH